MPKETLKSFSIARLSILNESGEIDQSFLPDLSPKLLKGFYQEMLRIREFDERAVALQRQGRMGTFAGALGQEAVHVGSALALQKEDWAVPSFREQGVYLSRGVAPKFLFLFFMGTEEGNRIPPASRILPYAVPCATQTLHAVGIAMAAKIRKEHYGVITYFGDGATSEGDLHEAMNFASVAQAPVVFLCQNNQWAISTPLSHQTHSATLAQRALAYDMPGLVVDGNDVMAVHQATAQAMERARHGEGPSFIEAVTYRLCAHTTSDDPSRYCRKEQIAPWRKKDPLHRLEKYLMAQNILPEGEKDRILNDIRTEMKQEAAEAEDICRRLSPDEIFTYLFKNMPEILKVQRDEALRNAQSFGEDILHA